MWPIRNISYLSPMYCSFWEKCKSSPKTGLGCSTPLICAFHIFMKTHLDFLNSTGENLYENGFSSKFSACQYNLPHQQCIRGAQILPLVLVHHQYRPCPSCLKKEENRKFIVMIRGALFLSDLKFTHHQQNFHKVCNLFPIRTNYPIMHYGGANMTKLIRCRCL